MTVRQWHSKREKAKESKPYVILTLKNVPEEIRESRGQLEDRTQRIFVGYAEHSHETNWVMSREVYKSEAEIWSMMLCPKVSKAAIRSMMLCPKGLPSLVGSLSPEVLLDPMAHNRFLRLECPSLT